MHINRNMSAVITNNQLLRTENKLAASMERLSSGFKINHASDNPAGLAISNKMKAQIDALDQAESNASDGISVLQIADGALNEVSSILQRMRELSVQAANGTNEYEDRQSIQAEIDELQKEVDRISTDTEYNTKALLDGSSDVRVYGDSASRFYVTDAVDAKTYAINVAEMATQADVVLDYKAPTEEGQISVNGVVAKITVGMTKEEYLHEVRNAAEEAGCFVEVDETANTLTIKSDHYGYDEAIEFTISDGLAQDLNVATNADCEYVVNQAAVTVTYPNPVTEGTVAINDIVVEVTATMTQDEYFEALSKAAQDAGLDAQYDAAAGSLKIVSESFQTSDKFTFAVSNDLADAMGIKDSTYGEYAVNATGTDAFVTIPTNREDAGFTSTTTVQADGNRIIITDSKGFTIDFLLDANYTPDVTDAAANEADGNYEIEVTDIGSLTIQIGANEHQTMDVRISEISSESLYIDTVDVAVVNGADKAMVTLDEAIAKLSEARSRIGAFQNRLDYASASLSETEENVTAAYSGLMDTDMAVEMAEYTQQNVLNQAAISVLAQANELPQQVLSLLQ